MMKKRPENVENTSQALGSQKEFFKKTRAQELKRIKKKDEKREKKKKQRPETRLEPWARKQKQKQKKNKNQQPEMRLGPWAVKQKQKQKKFGLPASPSVGARLSGTRDASGVVWAHSRHHHPPNPPRYVKT